MSIHPEGKSYSDLGRVLVLKTPPASAPAAARSRSSATRRSISPRISSAMASTRIFSRALRYASNASWLTLLAMSRSAKCAAGHQGRYTAPLFILSVSAFRGVSSVDSVAKTGEVEAKSGGLCGRAVQRSGPLMASVLAGHTTRPVRHGPAHSYLFSRQTVYPCRHSCVQPRIPARLKPFSRPTLNLSMPQRYSSCEGGRVEAGERGARRRGREGKQRRGRTERGESRE